MAAPRDRDLDTRRGDDARAPDAKTDAGTTRNDAGAPSSVSLHQSSPALAGQEPEPPRRRIGLHHIAFLRGYFEGLDPATLAEQYLEFGRDRKRAQTARRWIVDELVAAARKKGDRAGARLLKLPAGVLPSMGAEERKSPSLDDFRDQVDPDGVFSESELLALYGEAQQEVAASSDPVIAAAERRATRNARLRQRQRSLLDSLEASLAEPPKLVHPVAHWLDPALAARLQSASIVTIEDLVVFVNRFGYRWYQRVHRVGEQSARRVLQWFDRNVRDLAVHLAPHARLPRARWPEAYRRDRRTPSTPGAIAPIESFVPSQPAFMRDRETVLAWLENHRAVPATFRAYRTQVERLLLWSSTVAQKSLAALTYSDASAYMAFMLDPMPRASWCGRKTERSTDAWRPFEAPVRASTLAVAQRILSVLFDHLRAIEYLDNEATVNPFRAHTSLSVPRATRSSVETEMPGDMRVTKTISSPSPSPSPSPSTWATQAGKLRHLRMRAVLGVVRDTAMPLKALIHIPVSAVVDGTSEQPQRRSADSPQPASHTLTLRSRLTAASCSAIDAYLDMRRTTLSEQLDDGALLVGRHQFHSRGDGVRQALTPNILGRAIARYLKQAHRQVQGAMAIGVMSVASHGDVSMHPARKSGGDQPAPSAPLASRPPRNYREWRRSRRNPLPSIWDVFVL